MRCFVDREAVTAKVVGKRIAVVGSGPGVKDNAPRFVDSFDLVCRVNNYKTSPETGFRTDIHYSFYGSSIRKTREELQADGVTLCLCKCPDAKFMESDWHRRHGKEHGVDFRYIYRERAAWWFCDTYVPSTEEFVASFDLLGQHIPSTGFSAVLALLGFGAEHLYLTGFDFFASRTHNVDEQWRPGNPNDPIGHAPERERAWINEHRERLSFDPALARIMA